MRVFVNEPTFVLNILGALLNIGTGHVTCTNVPSSSRHTHTKSDVPKQEHIIIVCASLHRLVAVLLSHTRPIVCHQPIPTSPRPNQTKSCTVHNSFTPRVLLTPRGGATCHAAPGDVPQRHGQRQSTKRHDGTWWLRVAVWAARDAGRSGVCVCMCVT